VENVEEKGKGEGEKKEQWLAVETAEAGGELLSTVHMQREQWTMQKIKEKEKGKRKSSGWRWKRWMPVVRGSYSPLFTIHCYVSALFLVAFVYKVCNSTQKAA
jgi:hypothetical protein